MEKAQRILICPLNWGLGHASRCIPLIRKLLQQQKELVVATDGYPLELLKSEFPQLTFIHFPSYNIRYGKGKSQVWAMLRSFPAIVKGIYTEHKQLEKIIQEHRIDTVLSDNRFGLWNKDIRSLYMTHQLMVKMPRGLKWLEPLAWRIHRFFIHKYDVCLIPDKFEDGGYAGDLTHKYRLPENARFIGILSRFEPDKPLQNNGINDKEYKLIAVLSGVEPQRSLLEKILVEALSEKDFDSLIVQGLPCEERITKQMGERVTIVSHLSTTEMAYYLCNTPYIICRSGYSSVMDLLVLGRTALLIPTPGQTEQEYLAAYLSQKKLFKSVSQSDAAKAIRGCPESLFSEHKMHKTHKPTQI